MKTVLLYANEDSGFESRFQAALDVARACDAHISCVQITPYDAFVMGDPFGGVYAIPTLMAEVRSAEVAHRARIERRLGAEGVPWDWTAWDGAPARVVLERARLVDLIVLSLAGENAAYDGPLWLAADVALDAPAPVLAMPPDSRALDCFGPVLVAWDGSPEAAHALRLALPLLAKASAVHLVTVADDETGFPTADASIYLARHGLNAELHNWPRDRRSTAEALQDAAAVLHARYLVMGAYGHSRLREAVLGGATRAMLRTSSVPLLLAR